MSFSLSRLIRLVVPGRRARAVVGVCAVLSAATLGAHGSFHERMQQLAAAIERDPRDARSHFELAEIFCQHGDWALAIGAADSADALQPGKFPTDLVRGEAWLGAGQAEKAKLALDRFIMAHPGNARAHVLRARAFTATLGRAAALADYRAAVVAPEQGEPDHGREAAAALAACDQRDEAMRVLAAAIERFGPDPGLLTDALQLETAAGCWDAALARVAALQASAPRPEPWMARRADILARAGRAAEARAAWSAFLAHVDALPNLERGARPVAELAERAHAALAALPP